MNELQAALTIALANTYTMYFKAQSYHWNVEGMLFPQYHDFFGELYNELYSSVDDLAERIRTVDGYAPISLANLLRYATVREDQGKPASIGEMVSNLLAACSETHASLNKALELASQSNNQGLMDYLAGRLDAHNKHAWMLKSILKTTEQ
jgi:starvation-inducible DNA-binding protein